MTEGHSRPLLRFVPSLLALGLLASAFAQSAPVQVVATVGMVGDVVRNVAGECAEVTTIMGAGVDPHLYKASAGDIRTFAQAEAIFYSGYTLEGQLGEVLEEFGSSRPTVAVSEAGIAREELIKTDSAYGIDPHVWMDVSMWGTIPEAIAGALAEMRPDCAADLQARAEAYSAQLDALDGWVRESIATIPEAQRALVTAHDAFAYYGRAYGIDVVGIQGISTESEAALSDIRKVVDTVVERHIPALFVETSINPRTIEAVVSAVRDRGVEVDIGGSLFSDAFGEDGTWEGTYIGMLVKNTRTIVEALGGTPAALPAALDPWLERWPDVPRGGA